MAGCSTEPQPNSPGGGGTDDINLSRPTASPSALTQGQTTIVEVTATDANGDPIEGVSVTFVVSPTEGGYFTPATATTDTNGIAGAVF
ncbi:MAG: Ig-like domain-containing protein, partial [candidate division Zixibacteria bacterium]|nr:Ig-like domain-containing protein [candidate division Zixibacteria bacterium]